GGGGGARTRGGRHRRTVAAEPRGTAPDRRRDPDTGRCPARGTFRQLDLAPVAAPDLRVAVLPDPARSRARRGGAVATPDRARGRRRRTRRAARRRGGLGPPQNAAALHR